jgi:hypothetical protein
MVFQTIQIVKKIKGRFYFKQTSNGNLIGEWSNYESEPATESSDLQGEYQPTVQFKGTYNSTWQENGKAIIRELTITKLGKKFKLDWTEIGNNKSDFTGEGMLCDNILVGDYAYCGT